MNVITTKYSSSTEYNIHCTLSDRKGTMSIYAARNKFARHTKSSGTVINKLSTVPLRLHNHFHYPLWRTVTLCLWTSITEIFSFARYKLSLCVLQVAFTHTHTHARTHARTDTYTVEILLSKTFHNIKWREEHYKTDWMPDIMLPNIVFMLIKLGTVPESSGSLTIGDLEAHGQMQERLLNAKYKTDCVNISNCLALIV